MKRFFAAALLAASFATLAAAQTVADSGKIAEIRDAQSNASPAAVAVARQTYRDACSRFESAPFCECVASGLAQELSPANLRQARIGLRERMTAQGDAGDAMSPIVDAEQHYADVCRAYRAT